MNLYIYRACIYIYSIVLSGMDGAAGGQILSPRLFITQLHICNLFTNHNDMVNVNIVHTQDL